MAKMKTLTIGGVRFQVVDDESVHHTPQELSEEQQEQARENIGVGLPAVTADDNGKFLRATDGEWVAGEIRWNDLADKPFGETDVTVVMLPENAYDGFAMNSVFGLYAYETTVTPLFKLTIGETYTVKWDGVSYDCVAQDMSTVAEGAIGLGDLTLSGGIGNDEPFAIGWVSDGILFLSKDTETSHTVAIRYNDTIVEPLDAKFLPKPATSIDLSGFDSGTIVETFADGSTSTTVMEFDADGRPTKITDGNGNVTVLTW